MNAKPIAYPILGHFYLSNRNSRNRTDTSSSGSSKRVFGLSYCPEARRYPYRFPITVHVPKV
ncbi:hypothetical protein ER611_08135 [Streptococcus pyogenes]|uniref:Uncharacterized protein n=1 Tax=Streptococcus pyogenes TaxID=1314 RepID=A0A5S4TVK1_STRPY|nr:hypothetical protein B4W66_07695 [Streptococcus pyogenes]ASQ23369.1 hypothetical protein B5D85_06900 [Streptococcus pyogenes]AYJ02150.1 hypothetical protein D1F63_03450 [Streptococcus pyogenes]AYZ08907.1 hypothetical protein EGX80_01640 [Streptococcus pyogenes]AZA33247.1 hypothetical protein EHF39_03450 [Streptococcus pyogenes]